MSGLIVHTNFPLDLHPGKCRPQRSGFGVELVLQKMFQVEPKSMVQPLCGRSVKLMNTPPSSPRSCYFAPVIPKNIALAVGVRVNGTDLIAG